MPRSTRASSTKDLHSVTTPVCTCWNSTRRNCFPFHTLVRVFIYIHMDCEVLIPAETVSCLMSCAPVCGTSWLHSLWPFSASDYPRLAKGHPWSWLLGPLTCPQRSVLTLLFSGKLTRSVPSLFFPCPGKGGGLVEFYWRTVLRNQEDGTTLVAAELSLLLYPLRGQSQKTER